MIVAVLMWGVAKAQTDSTAVEEISVAGKQEKSELVSISEREQARPRAKVGVVLSGGGAKGMAHRCTEGAGESRHSH